MKGIGLSDSKGVDGQPEGWVIYSTVLAGDIHDARAPLLTIPPRKWDKVFLSIAFIRMGNRQLKCVLETQKIV